MLLDPIAVAVGTELAAGPHDANALAGPFHPPDVLRSPQGMSVPLPERIGRARRLRNAREYAAVREGGTPFRSRCAILVVLKHPDEPTRVGFIASKRGVGNAVQRNRARRRLREILRRRWQRVADRGYWIVLVASRGTLDASHERLVAEVEGLLSNAGILAPVAEAGR